MKNFILFPIVLLLTISTPTKSFTVDLIHRDSPLSPMYNSSMTKSELLQNAALRSISRHNNNNNIGYGSKFLSPLLPNQGDYLMRIYIGYPPTESLVVADTASDLSWIQCQPCLDCYKQDAPIFNPNNSKTFKVQHCLSESCDWLYIHSCGHNSECKYEHFYDNDSITSGELAYDLINFGKGTNYYPHFVFGCGHNNSGTFERAGTGLVGLNRGNLSLITQLGDQIGHRFSYCLTHDYHNKYEPAKPSKIKFGYDATISSEGLVKVPIKTELDEETTYIFNLEAISIENNKIQPVSADYYIIVDSASTLTFLETDIYENVTAAIVKEVGFSPEPQEGSPDELCFDKWVDPVLFPKITFHFGGANAGLQFQTYNFFERVNDVICFLASPKEGYSVLGSVAQSNFEILFDLEDQSVSFAPMDCSKYE